MKFVCVKRGKEKKLFGLFKYLSEKSTLLYYFDYNEH